MLIIGSSVDKCVDNIEPVFEYMRDNNLPVAGVGESGFVPPIDNNYSPPSSSAEYKKHIYDPDKKHVRCEYYFSNGDTFTKVRGMIDKMRRKFSKFAGKNKKRF